MIRIRSYKKKLDLDPDPDPHSFKILYHDPHNMNTDPKPKYLQCVCILTVSLVDGPVREEVALAVLVVERGPLLDVLHEGGDEGVHLHGLTREHLQTRNATSFWI